MRIFLSKIVLSIARLIISSSARFAFFLIFCFQVCANEEIGVVYPIVREPFSNIYKDFISGIKAGYPGTVIEYPLNGTDNVNFTKIISDQNSTKAIIVLGNKSLNTVSSLALNKPLFAAVTRLDSNQKIEGGILLKPGAKVYLSRLMEIAPQVAFVHVVYNPNNHQDLIDDAETYLKKNNIVLNAVPAIDIREAALGFRQVAKNSKNGDAVWLISDSGLIDGSLISLILDTAWDKNLVVFSSNPVFVKRGALFAIYPDNVLIGARLGSMAHDFLSGKSIDNIQSLRDVKVAFNERTGNHIGIKLSLKARENIELFLPEQ